MKKSPAPQKRHRSIFYLCICFWAIFIGELLTYTWCRVQCTNVGYALNRTTNEHERLLAIQKKLQIELSLLKSPERLVAVTGRQDQHKLVMPTSEQVITIK